jgi:hypothetical protein
VSEVQEGCTALLTKGDAGLRLVWDGGAQLILVEITHGPDGAPYGWLDLFKGMIRGENPIPVDAGDVTLQSGIEYGLELMSGRIVGDPA